MQKSILIPIDFHIESLNTLKLALQQHAGQKLRVVLLYAEQLSSSITSLLFYSAEKLIAARLTPEFQEALSILRNRFDSSLAELKIEVFHGYTAGALQQLLQARGIEEIYLPAHYRLKTPGYAFDPSSMLKKSGLPLHEMEWTAGNAQPGADRLESLFNN